MSWITNEEFGREFFARAVTTERISAAVAGTAGRGMKIGPFRIGPGGMAGVRAEGAVGEPHVERRDGDGNAFDLMVPASLEVVARLGGSKVRFEIGVEISLVLTAYAADPLLIVIEIPAITHRDVRLVVRAEALGSAGEWILEPIGQVLRREVANRINAMMADPTAVSRRVFDIAAIVDERKPERVIRTQFASISYAEFGKQFFRHAVSEDRILHALRGLDGREIDIGPLRTGPKNMAGVHAKGLVGKPRMTRRDGDPVVYDLTIPAELRLVIAVPNEHNFQAEITIALTLTARAAEPLLIVIDVPPVTAGDIGVELRSAGVRAAVIGRLGGVRRQIRAEVAKVVNNQLEDPQNRTIDVARRVAAAG